MRDGTLDRRDFLRAAGALSVTPAALPGAMGAVGEAGAALAAAGPPRPEARAVLPWPGYERALVVDFLASPGLFNTSLQRPLSAAMVRNAAESGITAVNLTVSGGDFESTIRRMAPWESALAEHPHTFRRIRTADDIVSAKEHGSLGLVYGFQDTTPLGSDASLLDVFRDLGVRVIQLTYNGRNLVGDGCLEPGNAGLSVFGHEVVERMNELGLMVDLSHCGQRTTAEGIAASRAPVTISHSGCRAVYDHPRSKGDEELRAMADKGGVLGVYLMPFLAGGRPPTAADVVAHIEHALQVCGEEHVGIGSDLSITPIDPHDEEYWRAHREFVSRRRAAGRAAPGEDEEILFYVAELNTPRRLERIADLLSARGHPDARIEKIVGGNFVRLARDVW